MTLLLLLHAAATLFMFGVICVMQIVHYPLFSLVGSRGFAFYQESHMRLITWVVGPAMLLELITALALVWYQPLGLTLWQVWTGFALLAIIWCSTMLVQGPTHQELRSGFDEDLHRRLVRTNWIRTVAWGGRSILVLAMICTAAPHM